MGHGLAYPRADSMVALNQWETALLCNVVSHLLGETYNHHCIPNDDNILPTQSTVMQISLKVVAEYKIQTSCCYDHFVMFVLPFSSDSCVFTDGIQNFFISVGKDNRFNASVQRRFVYQPQQGPNRGHVFGAQ